MRLGRRSRPELRGWPGRPWHLTGAGRHLELLLGCRWRRIRHIDDLNVKDQVFEWPVAGAGLLIVGHKSRDIQRGSSRLFFFFLVFTQRIVPTRDDLVCARNEFKRCITGAGHIGFKYFSGREEFTGIPYGYLLAGVYLWAIAIGLYNHIGSCFGLFRLDVAVSQVFLNGFDLPVFFFTQFLVPVAHHQVLGRENIQHLEGKTVHLYLSF